MASIKKRKKIKPFSIINGCILILLCITVLVPFLHLLSLSLSPSYVATKGGLHLIPEDLTWDNYKTVIKNNALWNGYRVTILRTVVGTTVQLFFTTMSAYTLSKPYFPHRGFWTFMIVFTMFFSGGLIPSYLLIKDLLLFNTFAVMILPGLIGPYNLVLMRNFFSSLPEELEESCQIDGAGPFTIFLKIVLPCSKPILATVALWLAVGHWNSWYDVLLYVTDSKKFVLQIILRRILLQGAMQSMDAEVTSGVAVVSQVSTEGLKAATVFVAIIPIMCVYPFIQKYFVKGVMVGSLKG